MSARIKRIVLPQAITTEQVIVDFNAERLKAPFLLRCGAILIDYILLVSVPVISLVLGRFFEYDGANLLNSKLSNAGWLVLILLVLTNFVILPMFIGQSIGKLLTGLKIVQTDGSAPTVSRLLARHLLGYPLTVLTLGIGFLLSVFNRKGRALHDFLAGTAVVYGRRRKERKEFQ
jgi:uncharacterized RDD family membrane protein YckC